MLPKDYDWIGGFGRKLGGFLLYPLVMLADYIYMRFVAHIYKLAIEALIEEDTTEVAEQDRKISDINKQITKKKTDLDGLRRAMYTGMFDDPAFFASEQETIKNGISRLEDERNRVMAIANDWKDIANDAFMFARYAKEDFDSDDWERKRAVIKRLGADLKLSGRTIQFTPVKYLVPVAESKEFLKAKKRGGSNRS